MSKQMNLLSEEQGTPLFSQPVERKPITHPRYNKENYPKFVCPHGCWNIYANDNGYCVSIPTDEALADGCEPTFFGDMAYVKMLASLGMLQL